MASESMSLGVFGIELQWTMDDCSDAMITSELMVGRDSEVQRARAEVIEALVLAHFKTGVDVLSDDYLEGLKQVVSTI